MNFDAQGLVAHHGGQQNSLSGTENNVTVLAGLSLGLYRASPGNEIRLSSHWLLNNSQSVTKPDTDGDGVETSLEWLLRRSTQDPEIGDTGGSWAIRTHASYFSGDGLHAEFGDRLYAESEYSQLGTRALFDVGDGTQIETALVLQYLGSTLDYTFQVYVSTGAAFSLWQG